MERKYVKAINFDLNTHQLRKYYLGKDYRKAYMDLRHFLKKNHFLHKQGSGYISEDRLTTADIYDLMDGLGEQLTWIGACVSEIDVTNVGRQYELKELLNGSEKIEFDDSLIFFTENKEKK